MKLIKIISIFLVLTFFYIGCERKPKERIIFEADLKVKIPETMTIYKFHPVPPEEKFIDSRKDQLNLAGGGRFEVNDHGLFYKYKSHLLFISPRTGSEMYIDSSKFMVEEPGKLRALNREKAIDLSKRYVETILKLDLKSAIYQNIKLLHNAIQGPNDSKPIETIDESIAQFSRKVNQFDVVGYGGFIHIHIDNAGTITGFQKVWREWEPFKEGIKIKPYERAKQEFLKLATTRFRENGFAKVVNVQFGYFERGFLEEQQFLQPAYVFDTAYFDKERKSSVARRLEIIAAGSELPEPIEIEKDYSKMDDIKK